MNKLMTASISPSVCKILNVCQSCVCFDCVRVCIHAFLVVFPSIYKAFLCMCVHCRQFVHVHTLTHTHQGKKTKPISLFQTHQWSSWGSLGQSKTTILRCRQDPVESCNLTSRSLTWWHETAGLARIFISDLLKGVRAGLNVTLRWLCFSFHLPHFLYF